jgi:hypothetical protein
MWKLQQIGTVTPAEATGLKKGQLTPMPMSVGLETLSLSLSLSPNHQYVWLAQPLAYVPK